jgi:hypothetical protein
MSRLGREASTRRAANAIQHWPRGASTRRALNPEKCFFTKPTFCIFDVQKIVKVRIGSNYLLGLDPPELSGASV